MPVFRNIFYSFPFQLVLLHLRRYLFMLAPWLLLILMVTDNFGHLYGFHYLFLDPEYLGKVNWLSFFIVGLSLGGFIFVWNITSYILNSFRFPFLATFERPFLRYSLNNAFFPLVFLIIYFTVITKFQYYAELKSFWEVVSYQLALLLGMMAWPLMTFNRSLNIKIETFIERTARHQLHIRKKKHLINASVMTSPVIKRLTPELRVDYLLIHPFRVRPVRQVLHYEQEVLLRVFRLHHKNALYFELIAFSLLVVLALFMEVPFFQIPSAASMLLMISILLAPFGALSYWLRSWAISAFIVLLILLNLLVKYNFLNHRSEAYGLNYHNPVAYTLKNIESAVTQITIDHDKAMGLQMLENWKKKVADYHNPLQKPPLIIVNASGGGLKASLWSFRLMQLADSVTAGRFFEHCVFISGASGGMIGEAYYRELYLDKKLGDSINLQNPRYTANVSKDILNAVSLTYVVNDLMFPFQHFTLGNNRYHKDRGYMFEKRWNENLGYIMNKSLADYSNYESNATVPMILFSPTIIDDGRRLLLSGMPVSYLTQPSKRMLSGNPNEMKVDAIDIHSFFKEQNGSHLLFTSAVRMNSTFPYILPNVYLPTNPPVQCMDAGMRDNYGVEPGLRFLYTFKDWINTNCSRVIIIQARGDYEKNYEPRVTIHPSLLQQILDPFTSLYSTWSDYHDFHSDDVINMIDSWLKVNLNVLSFEYVPAEKDQIASMSLHLTTREKLNILQTMNNKKNKEQMNRLLILLSH
ncbi:MAG: hypothetical protein H0W62_12455 [Chitinophagales bacterium]|nr:hypothetical protein [Chitinophagales bacterium]